MTGNYGKVCKVAEFDAEGSILTTSCLVAAVLITPGTSDTVLRVREVSGGETKILIKAEANGKSVAHNFGCFEEWPELASIYVSVTGTGGGPKCYIYYFDIGA